MKQIDVGMCTCQNTCETTEQLGGGCTPSPCVLVPGIEPRSSGSAGVLPAHTYYPQSSCLASPVASFFVITEIVSTDHGDKNQKIQRSECRQIKRLAVQSSVVCAGPESGRDGIRGIKVSV